MSDFEFGGELIAKSTDQGLVTGIAYEPNTTDLQGDHVREESLREAAHYFLSTGGKLFLNHDEPLPSDRAAIVESYIVPDDTTIGGRRVRRGSWAIVLKIHDPALLSEIRNGRWRGLSIGGSGVRSPDGELSNLRLREVSIVPRPANNIEWLMKNERNPMSNPMTPELRAKYIRAIDAIEAQLAEAEREYRAKKRGLEGVLKSPELSADLVKNYLTDEALKVRLRDFCDSFMAKMQREFDSSKAAPFVRHDDMGADDGDFDEIRRETRAAEFDNQRCVDQDNAGWIKRGRTLG